MSMQMFIAAVLCGIAAMLLRDIFYGLRVVFFKGVMLNVLLDCLWWALAGGAYVYCMWFYGNMDLRFFSVSGSVAAAFLYQFTLSGLVKQLFCKIFGFFYEIIAFILKILLTPAAFLYKILIVCIIGRLVTKIERGNRK